MRGQRRSGQKERTMPLTSSNLEETGWKEILEHDLMAISVSNDLKWLITISSNGDDTYNVAHRIGWYYDDQSAEQVEEMLQTWDIPADRGWR
jgi:hypothetical protein